MADLSDVLGYLAAQAATVLYPNGSGESSLIGVPVKIDRGWPAAADLAADLAAGNVRIGVSSLPRERLSSRYLGQTWRVRQMPEHTLVATLDGQTLTFGGTAAVCNILVRLDDRDYLYSVQPGDSLADIARALAANMPGAHCAGEVLTLPAAYSATVRIGAVGTVLKELRRQEKRFLLNVWAPSPTLRDQTAKALDTAFAALDNIVFADGSTGYLQYAYTIQSEPPAITGQYRRDLAYNIDYATTVTAAATEVIAPCLRVSEAAVGQTGLNQAL